MLRKCAIITLLQTKENFDSEDELKREIQKAFASTSLTKFWKLDRIAFLEEMVE